MRRALPSVLALVALAAGLASCSVDVEGATCKAVGTVDNCPSGQACGTDLKCSVKAAGCAPCEVGNPAQCRDGDVKQCSAAGDPVCGSWVTVTHCEAGLQTCQAPGGVPTCACDHWTVIPGVRPAAAICTQPSIKLAIDEAVKFPSPRVFLGGAAPATYGNELEDAAPVVIRAGVTLVGDDSSAAAATNRIIEVRGAATSAMVVEAGASVRGLTVRRFDAGAPAVGILVDGASPAGGNSLASVRVDVGGTSVPFGVGLRIAGGNAVVNDVAVGNVVVQGATVAGLEVNRYAASHVVLVTGSTFDQNQVGVSLVRGDLTLSGAVVKRSVAEGVSSVSATASFTSRDGLIARNGATGIVLTAVQSLVLERNRICGNSGTDKLYGGQTRKVGGLYSQGPRPPVLTFAGNRIHANAGDQMYVVASAGTWDVSGPGGLDGCATGVPNVFAGYSAPGVGLAALAANVLALNNSWEVSYPIDGVDFTAAGTCGAGACAIATGRDSGLICLPAAPADLTCPAP